MKNFQGTNVVLPIDYRGTERQEGELRVVDPVAALHVLLAKAKKAQLDADLEAYFGSERFLSDAYLQDQKYTARKDDQAPKSKHRVGL